MGALTFVFVAMISGSTPVRGGGAALARANPH
jgi:hypothetical protein